MNKTIKESVEINKVYNQGSFKLYGPTNETIFITIIHIQKHNKFNKNKITYVQHTLQIVFDLLLPN